MAKRTKSAKQLTMTARSQRSVSVPDQLLNDVRSLITGTREGVAQAVNAALVLLYWQIGQRIRTEVLNSQRANYGEKIRSTLSNKLRGEFGTDFSRLNLRCSRLLRLHL